MVLAAVAMLSTLVIEFTYTTQIRQTIAYGDLDQTKAHYIAKSALKISLLRLKAYQQIKELVKTLGGSAAQAVPKSLLNKVWNFPFFYPIPTNIPGMSTSDKETIEKFQKNSGIDGSFSALIESESSKYNLNLLLPGFTLTASNLPPPSNSPPPSSLPLTAASYNADTAQKSLSTYLNNVILQKSEVDPDFGSLYRDFRVDDLLDQITGWADRSYERRTSVGLDKVQMKRAPFYSVSELHHLPNMDDDLYKLFAPTLTTSITSGININTMQDSTLRALVPQLNVEEVKEFFKFRDSEEQDNQFGSETDFYKYLEKFTAAFKNNQPALDQLKKDLLDRGINLVVDEFQFKITVQAKSGSATRTIEAWVTLESAMNNSQTGGSGSPSPTPTNGSPGVTTPAADSGITITFMKIL
jgi:type II secretory pathway component PulK